MRPSFVPIARIAVCVTVAAGIASASAHAPTQPIEVREAPADIAVRRELPPVPAGVVELRFRDLIKLPIGPRGLEPGDGLLANLGKRVRLVGFMVRQADPVPGRFLLSPVPVEIGDADEGLADDVPAALVEIELADRAAVLPYLPGLLRIGGTLQAGGRETPGNPRIAMARIRPDARTAKALARVARSRPR